MSTIKAKQVITSSGSSLEDDVKKNNLTASAAPTVSNDNTQGYAIGSRWVWATQSREWVCTGALTGDAKWTETTASGGASLGATWTFDAATGDADPGGKKFRLNNATQANATFIYVSDTAESGVDMRNLLLQLGSGDRVYIQQEKDSTRYHLFQVTGDAVGVTNYVKIPVSSDSSGSDIEDGKKCPWLIVFSGAGAGVVRDESVELSWDAGSSTPSQVWPAGTSKRVWELDSGKELLLNFRLPQHIDLATVNPMIKIPFIVTVTGAGNNPVNLQLTNRYIATGELATKTADETKTPSPTVTDTQYRQHEVEVTLDRTKMAAGDKVTVGFTNLGTGAYSGKIGIDPKAQFFFRGA